MNIFTALSTLISLYTLICFIRIMLTWFPGGEYSKFGRILSQICDPYLNLFRRFSFLRFSAFDFTPAIALCILIAASTICTGLSTGSGFRIGGLLAMLVSMLWSVVTSILTFIAVILIVRLVVYLIKGDTSNVYSIWTSVDRAISPLAYKITNLFVKGRTAPFHTALIISIAVLLVFSLVSNYLIRFLCVLLASIPF